jgi:large subunit ribosomal protein L15
MPTFRRMPKRGFSNAKFRTIYTVVNVGALDSKFESGTHVTPQLLKEAGLIRNLRYPVKVLGDGPLTKKLTVDAAKYSKSALEKIQAAGGEAKTA